MAEVRSHVEQEQSRALGSRAGGGCWADCPAVWARGAASTGPDLSSGPACSLGAEERLERKNGWHLAEAAGDCSPHGMQEFLSRVHWDADALRDDLRAYVVEQLGDADAVLVLDETGFLKKGTKSGGQWWKFRAWVGRLILFRPRLV